MLSRDRIATLIVWSATAAVTLLFFWIVGDILAAGWSSLSWEFLTTAPRDAGRQGGIAPILVSTGLILAVCLAASLPVGIATAVLLSEFTRKRGIFGRLLRRSLDVLAGVPSIVFGFLAFLFLAVYLGWGKSWLAGGLILAIMIIPSLSFFLIDGLRALPSAYSETAKSLGLSADDRWWKLYVPLLLKPYLTGLFLSLGRAAGETAPILFVASVFYGATLPNGIKDNPILSLPYHIFQLSQEAYEAEALARLWSSALLIVLIVLLLQTPYYYFFWNKKRKGGQHAKLKLSH